MNLARILRPLLVLTAALALVAGSLLATAPLSTAAAAEVTPRPASGVLTLDGHGYGHGRGLSQWGAYGAATSGLDWTQILAFYYSGTTRTAQGNTPVRVHLSVDTGDDVRVDPAAGLTLVSGTARAALPTGSAYQGWRLVGTGTSVALHRLEGGTWFTHASPVPLAAGAGFTTASESTRLVLPSGQRMALRGTVTAVPDGTSLRTVAVMAMDSYLRGVVPAEMPASWHVQALRAQAVAARTYAARLRAGAGGALWDTCDTTACQVFAGTATYSSTGALLATREHPRTDQAIADTAGNVLTFVSGGRTMLVLTEFSASNGGWTTAGPPQHPYQVAKPDPYDGVVPNSVHSWTTTLTAARIEAAYPTIGTLRQISIDARTGNGDLGGRVLTLTVFGSAGVRTVTGEAFRITFGLRSNWFRFAGISAFPRDLDADGEADVMAITAGGTLMFYPGDAGTGFRAPVQAGTRWTGLSLVSHAGDWNGDGRPDLVGRATGGRLLLYPGDGDGTVSGGPQIGSGWSSTASLIGPGDWDGDGRSDLLAVSAADARLRLYRGDGAGGFAGVVQVGSGWSAMQLLTAVGDVTGDGVGDLVARQGATTALIIYPGNGRGGFGAARTLGRGWNAFDALVGPGDWNGDGRADLLARRTDGALMLYPGTGNGFGVPTQVGNGWSGLRVLS